MTRPTNSVVTAERWQSVCTRLSVVADPNVYRQLIKAWCARSRHYHSLAHLEACLTELDSARQNAHFAAEVEMALWFHDAIYKTYSKHNEERSAEWAAKFLVANKVTSDVVHRIREHILATKHAADTPQDPVSSDRALVVDIDLSILGQSSHIYAAFERNVRKEYWWVSTRRFIQGRTAILKSFLDRPSIFVTEIFVERYESQARLNLQHALTQLHSQQ